MPLLDELSIKLQQEKKSHKLTQQEFLTQYGIQKSFLTYHNFGSKVYEHLELGMPYMVMYELVEHKHDRSVMLEFTECGHNYIHTSWTELSNLGERPQHTHDFYEMTIVLSGELQMCIEDEIITYHAGECCFCNKSIRHKEIFDNDYEIVLFMFQEEYLQDFLRQNLTYDRNGNSIAIKYNFLEQLFEKNKQVPFLPAKEYIDFTPKKELAKNENMDSLLQIINHIITELSNNDSGRIYILKGLLCRLFSYLDSDAKYTLNIHHIALSKEEQLYYKISMYLEKHAGHITRDELEQKLNYNSDYMNRIIKKYTGMTLNEYGKKFLLEEAENYLKNTELSISEICEKLGYSNRTFFNKIFTDKYQMPPNEFRKSCKAKNIH